MIDMTKGNYIHAIWFFDKGDVNVLACLSRRTDERWKFAYRFRYDAGTDDPHDGTDKKNFYEGTLRDGASEEEAVAACKPVLALLTIQLGKPDVIELRCDGAAPKVFFELASKPWTHLKEYKP